MKKIILLTMFLSACTALPINNVMPESLSTPTAQATATPSIVPTATLDYAATSAAAMTAVEAAKFEALSAQQDAINAQATSQAAQVEIIAFTAAADAALWQATQYAQMAEQTAVSMTQASVQMTATARPTAEARRVTQEALAIANMTSIAAQLTAQAGEPERIRQVNMAQDIAQFGWMTYFAQIVASLGVMALGAGLFVFLYKHQPTQKAEETETETIPFKFERTNGGWVATRAEIPVEFDDLFEFASGVINDGKTAAYDVWSGILSRRILVILREFMLREGMAQEVKAGEITIIQKGREFLSHVLRDGKAPLPYKCITPKIAPLPDVRTSNVPTSAVGEVKN